MPGKLQKLLIILLVGLGAIIAVLVLRTPPGPSAPPLPQPNGYDDLVKAGGLISDPTADYTTMTETELRALVGANAQALKLARIGLSRECRVPSACAVFTNGPHLGDLSRLKRLAQAFAAEGRLAEAENRPGEAAEAYLADLRLGQEVARGGVIIDSLVGIAAEAIGTAWLEKLVPTLDLETSRKALSTLEAVEARREPVAVVLEREKECARRVYGLKGEFVRLLTFRTLRRVEQSYVAKVNRQEVRIRQLQMEMAARAYELEKGRRPASLAELVPVYLQAIPRDPLTGSNMVYRP